MAIVVFKGGKDLAAQKMILNLDGTINKPRTKKILFEQKKWDHSLHPENYPLGLK